MKIIIIITQKSIKTHSIDIPPIPALTYDLPSAKQPMKCFKLSGLLEQLFDELPFDELPFDELSFDELPFDESPFDELPFDELRLLR